MSKSIKCINQQICQLLDTKTYRLASAFDTKRHIHVPALSVMHKLALTKKTGYAHSYDSASGTISTSDHW